MAVVAIPIEIKVREFYGKLFLAAKLARAGHKVALGDKVHLNNILAEEVEPDVYISKSMVSGDGTKAFFRDIRQAGGLVTVLDAEGGLGSSQEDWLDVRVSRDLLEYVDGVFAWGETQFRALQNGTSFSEEDIHLTGNPRFDLLLPELRGIYSAPAEQISEEFGDYILVNTNFGLSNPYSEAHLEQSLEQRDIQFDEQKLKYRSSVFEEFLTMIPELHQNIRQNVVVRPHPGENHETYLEMYRDKPGLSVEHSGDVRNWITGADAVVHNGCTTGIESALLNKAVVAYEPQLDVDPPEDFSLPNHVSKSVSTVDELIQRIDESTAGDEYRLSDTQASTLETWIENVDKPASPRIVNAIDELAEEDFNTDYPEMSWMERIKSFVKKQPIAPYIQRARGQSERRSGKRKQKIPDLTLNEVESVLADLNLETDQLETSQVTYIDSVFWIDGS